MARRAQKRSTHLSSIVNLYLLGRLVEDVIPPVELKLLRLAVPHSRLVELQLGFDRLRYPLAATAEPPARHPALLRHLRPGEVGADQRHPDPAAGPPEPGLKCDEVTSQLVLGTVSLGGRDTLHCTAAAHGSHLGVGVGTLLASEGLDNVDKSAVVLDPPLGAAGLLFLLLLGLDLEKRL